MAGFNLFFFFWGGGGVVHFCGSFFYAYNEYALSLYNEDDTNQLIQIMMLTNCSINIFILFHYAYIL